MAVRVQVDDVERMVQSAKHKQRVLDVATKFAKARQFTVEDLTPTQLHEVCKRVRRGVSIFNIAYETGVPLFLVDAVAHNIREGREPWYHLTTPAQ